MSEEPQGPFPDWTGGDPDDHLPPWYRPEWLEYIYASLWGCARLSREGFAREVSETVVRSGGGFLDLSCQPVLEPLSLIEDGQILSQWFQSGALTLDERTAFFRSLGRLAEDCAPVGSLSSYPENRLVAVGQSADKYNNFGIHPDRIALGLVNFVLRFHRVLGPHYGWVDEAGDSGPDDEAIARGQLQYLFWANLFGPELAAAVGHDFLAAAPGGTLVRLDDGGALFIVTESFLAWRQHGQEAVLAHFRRRFPDIQRYRAVVLPT